MAKTTASLVGVVALLFADPAACFVLAQPAITFKQGGACSAHVCVDSMRNRATRAMTTTAEGRRRPRYVGRRAGPGEPTRMAAGGGGGAEAAATGVERETVAIEASEGVPRGPEGAIKLTYLEGNSWMCQVNGLNLLVDPVFGVLDFGVPALIQARKRVLWDGDRVTRDLAAVTDFLVISQGFDDHCHPRTVQALAGLLDPSVRVVAPPSAQPVLEEHFPTSRITYILPGQSTVLSAGGRAVEVEAVNGATLGPPWQQAENGYFIRPAASAANGDGMAPEGGTLYLEPHLMFDDSELSAFTADVVIAPVVEQNVGPYPLVRGGARALELASTLKASKLVSMANGDGDFTGPVRNAIRQGNTLQEFLDLARDAGRDVVVPEPAKPINVWP